MKGHRSPPGFWSQAPRWKQELKLLALLLLSASFCSAENDQDINAIGGEFEAAFQGKCGPSSPCVQLCVELHDGTFECQCRQGYRLLLDGYNCVELSNSSYTDEDSDELDLEYPSSSDPKPSSSSSSSSPNLLRAAKSSATKSPSSLSEGLGLEGRPLPRPIASSSFQPKLYTKKHSNEKVAKELSLKENAMVAAAEAAERNNYLKKFSPVDNPKDAESLGLDFFGIDAEVMAKAAAVSPPDTAQAPTKSKASKSKEFDISDYPSEEDDSEEEDEDDLDEEDEDGTNEAEEDLRSTEEKVKVKVKEEFGGGEEESEEEDFIVPPPRALPLVASSFPPPTTATPTERVPLAKDAPPEPSGEVEKKEENCPLKCNRGLCIKENPDNDMSYRCLCPMGTKGSFCEIEDKFEEGSGYNSGLFRGRSWVAFPVLHDAYMADQISLEFRPQEPNGILLLTGERDDLSGDYLALFLRDGYLEFRFDCGSGSGLVRSSTPVNLQQWNKASIVRRRWDGWMQLNDGPFTQGRSKGLFSRITFRQPVYIGGQGNITFTTLSSIQSNFDDEPELSSSSPSTTFSTSVDTNNNNQILNTSTPNPSPSPSPLSPSAPTDFPSGEIPLPLNNLKNVGSPNPNLVNSVEEPSSTSFATETVGVLKKIGGLQGCIRNLVINDRVYRFGLEPAGDSLQGWDLENCNDQGVCDLVKCQHGGQCLVQKDENPTCLCPLGFSGGLCETPLDLQIPSFNGSSYLKYGGLGLTRVLSWLEMEIVVKPDSMDGLILYNGYKTDGMGDFISLIIDQGYIEFAMDLGTGAAIIRSDTAVALGEWHHIHVSRTSRLISLRIDNQPPLMALTPGAFTQLSLPHNLFLGGIPDPLWLSPKVKVQGGFTGCIQKLVINEKPLRIMGSAMSGVNLENCEHPCLRNPCDHGGDCVPQLESFKCHCILGYRDPYCQTRMDKEDVITAPKFIGDSYLKFTHPKIIKRISGWRLNLSFRVKTDSSRGLLMWAGRKWMTSASDFISVGLRAGLVTASFSLGSGQTTIAYNYTAVNDGHWHHVMLIRNEQEASLSVDDGPPITGLAPGKLRQLNINDGLYIGGVEESRHQSVNRYAEGFVGCLTDVVLGSERVSLLQEASEGRNVDYCD